MNAQLRRRRLTTRCSGLASLAAELGIVRPQRKCLRHLNHPAGFRIADASLLSLAAGAVAATVGWRLATEMARAMREGGTKSPQVASFVQDEILRWGAVSLATTTLSFVGCLVIAFRRQRPSAVLSLGKAVAFCLFAALSTNAAYVPEWELVRAGWIVHPPRLAIFLPSMLAIAVMTILALVLLPRRAVAAA